MPKGQRRNRKDILSAQIEAKYERIEVLNGKVSQLQRELESLQDDLDSVIESENRAAQEAKDKELLSILKKHNVSKERLLDILSDD